MGTNFFTKLIGSRNDRLLKQYRKTVRRINAMEADYEKLSEEALRGKTQEFRDRLAKGEALDDLLPEAFAVVREGSKRVMKMRHFDVQLIGGMVLHDGKIAEMRTGEGKTLTATLAVYLNALAGKGVHVVTVNDYLASRDAQWMGQLYNYLGLTVGINLPQMPREEKQAAYNADITYGTNNEYGFDYLRDNMVYETRDRVQRKLHYAIVDEVDSILIDEARTPLIISGQAEDQTALYVAMNKVVPLLKRQEGEANARTGEGVITPGDFTVDEKQRQVTLTEQGFESAERILASQGLIADGQSLYAASNISLVHHLYAALRAHQLFNRDEHYVVQDGEVVIVDEFTGRLMAGRRWSEGLHQAVEAKEGVKIQAENQTLASITFQNYFRLYTKLSGMTGTADTEAYEFQDIYGLETVIIPPNKPSRRDDQLDRVYKTTREKYEAAIADIRECHEKGQPVLVGTSSIENSEIIDELLTKAKLPHQVLNAKQHEREADIIAQAGHTGAITIATNMAGRGTDIVLGGNIDKRVAALLADESLSESERERQVADLRAQWKADNEKVVALGGLRIIATERHESRRIDNQLRGRSGRQGDPGSSRFYLSLDDPLMRIFAGDRVKSIMERLKMPDGEAIEAGMVSRSIESAQRKVEGRNFDMRKQLLEYDDVANEQRKVIYQQRNEILDAADLSDMIAAMRDACITDVVRLYVPAQSVEEQWDLAGLEKDLAANWQLNLPLVHEVQASEILSEEDIVEKVVTAARESFDAKVALVGKENFHQFERAVLLQSLDTSWRDHLTALDYLRQGIHLRSYAQVQPKQEYKRESFEMFRQLLDHIRNEVTRVMMTVQVQSQQQVEEAAEAVNARNESVSNVTYSAPTETGEAAVTAAATGAGAAAAAVPRVGRNDPCPCGSGKKYKHCHGKLA
ncbi:MAG: preprotein translocase subunit SecA [Comamonas sp. SCN 67-35]|uniref:preprotein translocase subunit SecA n=1 Tax=unclassified Comamonas TaxID=2638500 RepID=UPI00086EA65E|nr:MULTISPECIES: preprotein translocase subunit SecA [unclassified Comamonas]MBN9331543.1 preprotein translocase subunit SecA [Comamonas sp.]ODU37124.1 MAG: preprotein translocase subunit SecA [Comamonas sp. SCN 67-35]OJW99051.1 MAG: preprotein translocase subunit SecA [Burkholderiales bacterium 66-26]